MGAVQDVMTCMPYHTHTQKPIQGLQLVCIHQLVVDCSQISHIVRLVGMLHTGATSQVDVGS